MQGFSLLRQRPFRSLVIVPLAINFALYAVAVWLSIRYFSVFMESFLPQWLGFLKWVLWPVFGLVFLFLVSFTFTLVANVLGAPFYGILAERLLGEQGLLSEARRPSAVRSAFAGMAMEARRVTAYLLRAIPFLLLFLIPGLNVAAPFLWLAYSAWSLAQDYYSYPLDALGIDYVEQQRMMRSLRSDRLVFGGLVQLGLTVPLLNVLVSPVAVAGATQCVIARMKSHRAIDPAEGR